MPDCCRATPRSPPVGRRRVRAVGTDRCMRVSRCITHLSWGWSDRVAGPPDTAGDLSTALRLGRREPSEVRAGEAWSRRSGVQPSGTVAQWQCQGRRSLAVVLSYCLEWPHLGPGGSAPGSLSNTGPSPTRLARWKPFIGHGSSASRWSWSWPSTRMNCVTLRCVTGRCMTSAPVSSSLGSAFTSSSGRTTMTPGAETRSGGTDARRLGAFADQGVTEAGPADIELADGTPLYVDGGPFAPPPLPAGIGVVHRWNTEAGSPVGGRPTARPGPTWPRTSWRPSVMQTGGARVIAPAGSGKTRVLTERLRHLIEDCGAEPSTVTAARLQHEGGGGTAASGAATS